MPLSAGGQLSIVASSDLGALGSKEGAPVVYNCVMSGVAPLLLPWLVVLGLLALKPNRCLAAWAIWLPVGCVLVLSQMRSLLPDDTDFLADVIAALAAGLAGVWLLSTYLRRQYRFVTFLCVLAALGGISLLAFLSQQTLNLSRESVVIGIALAVGVLVTAAALSLCGLICRGRYRPFGLYVWLPLLVVGLWVVIAAPIYLCMVLAEGGMLDWGEFWQPVLAAAAVHYATLLPFLLLSSASPLFRQRLKTLLHTRPEPPPVMPPLPAAAPTPAIP